MHAVAVRAVEVARIAVGGVGVGAVDVYEVGVLGELIAVGDVAMEVDVGPEPGAGQVGVDIGVAHVCVDRIGVGRVRVTVAVG